MKTKRFFTVIVLLGIFAFNITGLKAQDVLNVYAQEHTNDRKPVPYQYLREADVMWSKTIWRIVELKEKMNHPLYYPLAPMENGKRKSMIDLLMWAIQNQGLTAYSASSTDEFATIMTMKDIEGQFGAKDVVMDIEDPVTGAITQKTIPGEYSTSDVKQLMLKEMWFFDKQRSVLEVRIIGMCPIYFKPRLENIEDPDSEVSGYDRKQLFWVYFPEARKIFANNEAFNSQNEAEGKSYDDIFFLRMFSSHIVQESNAYGNRRIASYTLGLETLLEAERIKESIFNFEQDLWEY